MQPATKMMTSYQNSPSSIDEEDTAVPLVPTILSPTTTTIMTTTSYRSKWVMIAIVVAMMMLVAGGMVLLWDGESAAEGLVVATQENGPCLPATDTFSGISVTVTTAYGHRDPFETCYQYGEEAKYCWSKSYYVGGRFSGWYPCVPNPKYAEQTWELIDPKYVNPVTHPYSCGEPCQDMYQPASRVKYSIV